MKFRRMHPWHYSYFEGVNPWAVFAGYLLLCALAIGVCFL